MIYFPREDRLLGARTLLLLGAPGRTTRNKKLLGAPGIATRSKDAIYIYVYLFIYLFFLSEWSDSKPVSKS